MTATLRILCGTLLLVGVIVSGFVYQTNFKFLLDLALVVAAMNILPHPKLSFRH